ncbi:chemotaxis protein CheW [Cohnella thailandensis]|uniref:Purine-binding chemotaxis protein CheW n=1 Tax=Cohnella thailandensis TaxID=557557 RepID=A0A841SZU3_9BACL|nr:chemotaxis protein CheW [Cohnella thailandensis]MBB6637424.1 purine-binding chemotaxis protein CheW [Cohnella thailandensis]MBP1976754.1 purine-binding chemotaxis protein CheW [Cohnella thailandensis]
MSETMDQYVKLEVAGQRYAIRIEEIGEIIKPQHVTKIPGSKSHILGVTNVRGNMVPIVSLRHQLGMGEIEFTSKARIVVANYRGELVGVKVDGVSQVVTLSSIQPAEEAQARKEGFNCEAIGHSDEGLVGILSLSSILEGQAWHES